MHYILVCSFKFLRYHVDQHGRCQQRKTPKRKICDMPLTSLTVSLSTIKHLQVQKVQRLHMEEAHGLER